MELGCQNRFDALDQRLRKIAIEKSEERLSTREGQAEC